MKDDIRGYPYINIVKYYNIALIAEHGNTRRHNHLLFDADKVASCRQHSSNPSCTCCTVVVDVACCCSRSFITLNLVLQCSRKLLMSSLKYVCVER